MQPKVTGTWHDDPAHFQRPTRRSFLYVGFVGGLGLTLDSFFRLQARADTKAGGKEPQAKSIIHIFLPGGMAHQDTFDPPPGAVHLAASDLYEHQAFRFGRRAYGLQFHVEVDEGLAEAWRPRLPPGVEIDPLPPGTGRALLGRFLDLAP